MPSPVQQKLEFQAAFKILEAAAGDPSTDKRVSIDAYNGGPLRVDGWHLPVVLDLQGCAEKEKRRVSLLHEHSVMVGHTDNIEIGQSAIKATGSIYMDNNETKEITSSAARGFEWKASVGVRVAKRQELRSGEKATVNNFLFTGPLIIARSWSWKEITFTKWPADDTSSVRIAAQQKGTDMTLDEMLAKLGLSKDTATAEQLTFANELLAKAQAAAVVEPKKTEPEVKEVAATGDTAADVAASIRKQAADQIALIASVQKKFSDFPELAAKAIGESWDEGRCDAELRAAKASISVANRPNGLFGFGINTDVHKGVEEQSVIEAALALSAGVSSEFLMNPSKLFANDASLQHTARRAVQPFSEQTLDAAVKLFDGIGLQETCLWAARRDGNYEGQFWGGGDKALRASFSTLSLPTVFQNTLNRILLENFAQSELTWKRLAKVSTAKDFRTIDRFRVYGTGQWEVLGPDGELKHGNLSEGVKYTNQLSTIGQLNVLTRADFINDDLGALNSIGEMMARYGALAPEFALYNALIGNTNSFFSAGNSNLLTSTALAQAGLRAAHTKFRNRREQRTSKDQRQFKASPSISVTPKILLVPIELEVLAWELMNATQWLPGTTTSNELQPDKNYFQGKYDVLSSPYLSDTAINAAATTTTWYLFSEPAALAAYDMMFLNGQQVPIIESAEADFSTLGMQFRGYTDFGVAPAETMGALRMTA